VPSLAAHTELHRPLSSRKAVPHLTGKAKSGIFAADLYLTIPASVEQSDPEVVAASTPQTRRNRLQKKANRTVGPTFVSANMGTNFPSPFGPVEAWPLLEKKKFLDKQPVVTPTRAQPTPAALDVATREATMTIFPPARQPKGAPIDDLTGTIPEMRTNPPIHAPRKPGGAGGIEFSPEQLSFGKAKLRPSILIWPITLSRFRSSLLLTKGPRPMLGVYLPIAVSMPHPVVQRNVNSSSELESQKIRPKELQPSTAASSKTSSTRLISSHFRTRSIEVMKLFLSRLSNSLAMGPWGLSMRCVVITMN
jgi:hypothetical protein